MYCGNKGLIKGNNMCTVCRLLVVRHPPALTSSRMRPPSRPRDVEAAGTTTPASHYFPRLPRAATTSCVSVAFDQPSDLIEHAAHRAHDQHMKECIVAVAVSGVGASIDVEAEPHCCYQRAWPSFLAVSLHGATAQVTTHDPAVPTWALCSIQVCLNSHYRLVQNEQFAACVHVVVCAFNM